jgi:hypothetical protein|tara:strand:+ start:1039 stop:1362 length:324 start_codon:yes stop_codon:yes gene_type:complete
MATTYTTVINQMYTVDTPAQGFVANVLFTVSGTNGTNTASIDGNITFKNEEKLNFIAYNQLTESQVLAWINAETNNLENYYANIDGQINSMINPPVSPQAKPLPWSA